MSDLQWPEAFIDVEEVCAWISAVLPDQPHVTGPTSIDHVKNWGVVARFQVASEGAITEVVFKAGHIPLFTYGPQVHQLLAELFPGHIPLPLAWQSWPERTWTLYHPFSGEPVPPNVESLIKIVELLAQIQIQVADLPAIPDFMPRTAVTHIPAQLDLLLEDVESKQWAIWQADNGRIAQTFDIHANFVTDLQYYRPQILAAANALASMGLPDSIDHVDLHLDNAIIQPDDRLLIYDWDEAVISHPCFSVDRLLFDARDLDIEEGIISEVYDGTYSPGETAVRDAYLAALPWKSKNERKKAFDLAMLLAPIKTANEGRIFAAGRGFPNGIPYQAAMLLSRTLRRWEAIS